MSGACAASFRRNLRKSDPQTGFSPHLQRGDRKDLKFWQMGLRETSSIGNELKFGYPKDEDLSPLFNPLGGKGSGAPNGPLQTPPTSQGTN